MLVARGVDTGEPGDVPGHVDQPAGLRRVGLGGGQQEVSLKSVLHWLGWLVVVAVIFKLVSPPIYGFVGGGMGVAHCNDGSTIHKVSYLSQSIGDPSHQGYKH